MGRRLCAVVIALCAASAAWAGGDAERASAAQEGVVWLEFWTEANMVAAFDKDNPWSKFYAQQVGVGLQGPMVSWNGGTDYIQQLQLRVAAKDLPDLFMPWNGIEVDLARQGAIVELTNYLPRYTPTVWKGVPDNVWNIVRANSPDGKGIFYVPSVWTTNYGCGFVRVDWMRRVGIAKVPQTIDEYVAALRIVKNTDANGNGDAKDEFPTGGRQLARWMDHLFAPFGIAMYEGFPDFGMYDGKLTYSGVTPNMKAALAWIASLYKEGLMDPETLLNSKQMWEAKLANDQVFSWFHIPAGITQYLQRIGKTNKEVEIEYLPPLKGSGFEPFYSNRVFRRPQWCIAAKGDEKKVLAALRWIEFVANPANDDVLRHGVEGVDYKIVNGAEVRTAPSQTTWNGSANSYLYSNDTVRNNLINKYVPEELRRYNENAWRIVQQTVARPIEGESLPVAIYKGYPDVQSHSIYAEYASKIILGQWPIDKFDELVKKWNESGGAEVTRRAREIYAKIAK